MCVSVCLSHFLSTRLQVTWSKMKKLHWTDSRVRQNVFLVFFSVTGFKMLQLLISVLIVFCCVVCGQPCLLLLLQVVRSLLLICLSVCLWALTYERVYGCRPDMVGIGRGLNDPLETIEFWCWFGFGSGTRIEFSLSLALGDRHFILRMLTHQMATLQQPWRSLRSQSTSCFFVSSVLFAFIVCLLLGVLSVLGVLQVRGKGRWKGRKGRGMNGEGRRKREGGERTEHNCQTWTFPQPQLNPNSNPNHNLGNKHYFATVAPLCLFWWISFWVLLSIYQSVDLYLRRMIIVQMKTMNKLVWQPSRAVVMGLWV